MWTPDEILQVLDRGAENFVFPILDNGYVYLAATRMRLHRSENDWALVFEVFGFSRRFLAAYHRDRVLATSQERRVNIPDDVPEILQLDDWIHPDLANRVLPSECDSFVQLAHVLSSGDPSKYHPGTLPNTHWRNWPEGGTL